jgi:hypothetical protein
MKRSRRGLKKRYGHSGGLRRFAVYTDVDGFAHRHGVVSFPMRASYVETEAALVRIGVYAPRGLDRLKWGKTGARIVEPGNWTIVKLRRLK